MRYDTSWRQSWCIWTSSYRQNVCEIRWHARPTQYSTKRQNRLSSLSLFFVSFFLEVEGLLAAKFPCCMFLLFLVVCLQKKKKCFVNVLLIFLKKMSLCYRNFFFCIYFCMFIQAFYVSLLYFVRNVRELFCKWIRVQFIGSLLVTDTSLQVFMDFTFHNFVRTLIQKPSSETISIPCMTNEEVFNNKFMAIHQLRLPLKNLYSKRFFQVTLYLYYDLLHTSVRKTTTTQALYSVKVPSYTDFHTQTFFFKFVILSRKSCSLCCHIFHTLKGDSKGQMLPLYVLESTWKWDKFDVLLL